MALISSSSSFNNKFSSLSLPFVSIKVDLSVDHAAISGPGCCLELFL